MTGEQAGVEEDVVTFLERQHQEIRALFVRAVEGADDGDRRHAFRDLVRLLAVHETAEEELVHPYARRVPDGEAVVQARLGEERRAKELLSTLDRMGPDADGFDTLLLQLRDDVLAHAEHEEREEFPRMRAGLDADLLRKLGSAARTVEAMAPTRPHPGVESATANVLLGPPLAVMDRARDLIRAALGR